MYLWCGQFLVPNSVENPLEKSVEIQLNCVPELSDLCDGCPVVVVGVVLLHHVEQPPPAEVLDATGHEVRERSVCIAQRGRERGLQHKREEGKVTARGCLKSIRLEKDSGMSAYTDGCVHCQTEYLSNRENKLLPTTNEPFFTSLYN